MQIIVTSAGGNGRMLATNSRLCLFFAMDTASHEFIRLRSRAASIGADDHPNTVKVIDGGTTQGGRPNFVMELVKGVALKDFCDKNRLTTAQRLKFFAKVCQAIQHTCQKGVCAWHFDCCEFQCKTASRFKIEKALVDPRRHFRTNRMPM